MCKVGRMPPPLATPTGKKQAAAGGKAEKSSSKPRKAGAKKKKKATKKLGMRPPPGFKPGVAEGESATTLSDVMLQAAAEMDSVTVGQVAANTTLYVLEVKECPGGAQRALVATGDPSKGHQGGECLAYYPYVHPVAAPRVYLHAHARVLVLMVLLAGWVTTVSAQGTEYLRGGNSFVRPNPSGGEEEEAEVLGAASVEEADEGEEGEEEEEEEEEEADAAPCDATTEGTVHAAAIDVS